jgi:hypothetical protein
VCQFCMCRCWRTVIFQIGRCYFGRLAAQYT